MATDLGQVKSSPANKYDAFVAAQLAQAEKRIRLLDLTAGLLGLAALILLYVVGMVWCDRKLLLPQTTRQATLFVFLGGCAVYLFWAVLRPLRLRVNPYYAARQVEQLLPQAKNSIVNWVDLHEQSLPPAIRSALGQRAAKDLSRVDLDRAISGRRAGYLGGFAGLFALAFLVSFLLLGPAPFASLLKRTFNPFGAAGVSTRTQLTILKPEGGDATVTVGSGLHFVVAVGGKVPQPRAADAVRLLYRYEEGDPWLERPLIPEHDREWTTTLAPGEIKNGFWYKIAGGDAVTAEHRVSVRAAPAITDFLATYHFRPYVVRADEIRRERPLKELRGTEVALRVRTNRLVSKGELLFEGKNGKSQIAGTVDPDEPHTLVVRFVLQEDGQYRVSFLSTDQEPYTDAAAYSVTAIPDNAPTVALTKPGQDIRLPADALLQLEGKASDDIGVKSLLLRMQVIGGPKLREQNYRSDERMRLADGGYPREVEYKDFVELAEVRSEDGRAVPLRAGMELEYWLEARDACDYPTANVAESKHYRVLLTESEKNAAKQKQQKQQAENEKKQHQQKEKQQRQKEERERQQQRQEQQARNQEEENKSKEGEKGAGGDSSQAKEGEQPNKPENKDDNGGQGENKNGQGGKTNEQPENKNGHGENNELPKEERETEKKIEKALEKQQEQKGEGKPEKSEQSAGKGGENKPDNGKANGSKSESENKDKGADPQNGKESGNGKGNDTPKGENKGNDSSRPAGSEKSEPKGGDPKKPEGAATDGESKDKPDSKPSTENKGSGDPQTNKDAGQEKPQPKGQGTDSKEGENKPADGKERQNQGKESSEEKENRSGRGEAKNEGEHKDQDKGEVKKGEATSKEEPSAASDAKPSGGKGADGQEVKGQSKPDAGEQARQATEKDIDDLARKLKSEDAAEREEAQRQLERIENEAAKAEAREKAAEALEKNGGQRGTSAGQSGQRRKPQPSQGENPTGGGGEHVEANGKNSGRGGAAQTPEKSAKPNGHRAAQMQLEDFAKRVNKDILKEAGVSEAEWKKYLESKRKQVAPHEQARPEKPFAPQQATPLPSMRGQTIQPAASGSGDTHGPDRGQPPPGYRDAFRKFTRQMSERK